jgi:hypothetical protein
MEKCAQTGDIGLAQEDVSGFDATAISAAVAGELQPPIVETPHIHHPIIKKASSEEET